MDQFSVVPPSAGETVYVGIDYATAFVQVCVMDRAGRTLSNRRLDNDCGALADHVARFGGRIEAAIEACTGAADLADQLVHLAGWSVSQAHPGYVNRMKRSPDKSDFSDAEMLADLTRVGYLPRVWLAPQAVRELRRLVRHRQDLVNRRRAVKLRIRALLREHRVACAAARPWTQPWLRWLQVVDLPEQTRWVLTDASVELDQLTERIGNAERQLAAASQDDPMVAQLCSCRGVGLITACVLRAEIGDVQRFRSGKQLSRFCGVTPCNASSGPRQADAGLIRAGSRLLRTTLIEAAHRLRRFDPRWRAFSIPLQARGKKTGVVVAAIANRWVRRLYHELQALPDAA